MQYILFNIIILYWIFWFFSGILLIETIPQKSFLNIYLLGIYSLGKYPAVLCCEQMYMVYKIWILSKCHVEGLYQFIFQLQCESDNFSIVLLSLTKTLSILANLIDRTYFNFYLIISGISIFVYMYKPLESLFL